MIFLQLFYTFFKIGLFGFGGGYAMLSLIRHEIMDPGWITENMFTDIVAISQMTPGPIGINSATYIGYTATGGTVLGAIVATVSVVLPSFLLVLYTSRFIQKHKDSAVVKGIFFGLRPIVVGLIGSAALLLMNGENFKEIYSSVAICVVAFILAYFVKLHPVVIVFLAGLAGYIIY